MRKFAMILAASGLALAACSSDNASETEPKEETVNTEEAAKESETAEATKSAEEGEGVNVDKGLFNVEVTIPASFFEGEDPEQAAADAEAEGVGEATVNEDGSVTYKMSKARHKELMEELATSMEEAKNEITESGDFPSIQSIESSKNYDNFTVNVDREAYENSFDGFATMTLGMIGSYYQIYDGADADSFEVVIEMADAATGEVFDTITYPEALEEMGEE
ncbi:hypothetical protein [Planococcus sp. CAU13]|uniref:hypothetical protein n=1 Tax=Planococcus sp. CAU13 TaxID=1541197 RepID=UPI0005300656|nr:hypothetical protein [Planococcus sp. CAU13]